MFLNYNNLLFAFFQVITILITIIYKTTSMSTLLGQSCSNATLFANGSTYQTNLNTVFRNLVSNATNNPSGFYRTTVGNPTIEVVYGQYLCSGDQDITSCHQCVVTATTTDLPKTYCPNRKIAVIWYDECMVRYSNASFFNTMDLVPAEYLRNSNNITGNTTLFMEILGNMMNKVIAVRVPEGGSYKKFAVDSVKYTTFDTMYGLGQCTPDLSSNDCYQCLISCIDNFDQSPGSRIVTPSCLVRYELYPFFNLSFLPKSPLSPSSPPVPSDSNRIITRGSSSGKLKLLAAIIVSVLLFLAALVSICIHLLKQKAGKFAFTNSVIAGQDLSIESLHYDLSTLLDATNNFSDENKLGEGGFGSVYKGTLSNGKLIAVKRLSASSSQGVQEFETEVLVVAKLQHRNLVRLLGYCYTQQEKLLVYEYVPNKSLDNFIFDHGHRRELDWQRRYNIIRGIARGLQYLHHDSLLRIIHRDLKASNVLLDEEMNPKISDFGTSRIFGVDQSLSNYTNRVVGTFGYMSPEYAMQGKFSIKSDVYSFGVLVLEIISGKRINNFNRSSDTEGLLSHASKQWEAGTAIQLLDPTIHASSSDTTEVMKCIQLGLLCVKKSIEDRPTMNDVVFTLDNYSATLPIPEQPDFFAGARLGKGLSKKVDKSVPLSVYEVSDITEIEPR